MARKRFIFYYPNPLVFLSKVKKWGVTAISSAMRDRVDPPFISACGKSPLKRGTFLIPPFLRGARGDLSTILSNIWKRSNRHLIWVILAVFVASLTAILPGFSLESPPIMAQVSSEHSDRSPEFWRQKADEYAQNSDFVNQAVALGNLSLALQERGEWEEARESSTQGINILEQLSATKERDKILAQSLDIQGKLNFSVGYFSAALISWQEAGKFYQQLGLTQAEDRNRLNQVQAMQELGLFQSACEAIGARIDETLSFCDGVKQENLPENLRRFSSDRLTVLHLQALGDVLRLMGDLESSQQVLELGLELVDGDTETSDKLQLSLGNTLRAKGDRQWAISQSATSTIQFNFEFCPILENQEEYDSALKHYQDVTGDNPLLNLQSHLNQLKLQVALDSTSVDSNLLQKTQNLINQNPNLLNTKSGNNLILNYLQTATCISTIPWQNIAQDLQTIIDISQQRKDLKTQSYALGYLGRLYEQHAQDSKEYLQTAKTHTQKALSIAQSLDLNAPELAYQWQWQLGRILEKTQSPHSSEILSAYKAAFNTLQSLRQELVSSNRDLQFSFRDEVEPVYRKYVDLLLQDNPSQDNLKEARNVIEALQLAELDDFFNDACITAKPEQIDKIVDESRVKTAVIYTILLENRLAIIQKISNQEKLNYYSYKMRNDLINDKLEDWLMKLKLPYPAREGRNLSEEFYKILIEPGVNSLKAGGVKNLVFISDGLLRNIPMTSLYDGQEYIINKYSVTIAPALQLLAAESLDLQNIKVLRAGVSSEQRINGRTYKAIPKVENELREIPEQISTDRNLLLNTGFTKDQVKLQLTAFQFPIIHIATHGRFSSNPEETLIVAWQQEIKVNDFDDLFLHNNIQTAQNTNLLILTACETATGDKRASLGLTGVALRAGARSTLSSLWRVEDESTAKLMQTFYNLLVKDPNISKAEALRQAQLELLNEESSYPYQWAPYVLVGNWE